MADQLGKLRARIEADSTGFTAGIKRCTSDVKGFAGTMGKSLSSLKGMIGSLGGALAGLASAAAIKGALDDLDRIGKLRQITGVATADLQKLAYAARQSGTDIESIAKSSRKMYAALTESPELFEQLGLSADKLLTLDLPSQLGMIGDALNGVTDGQERANIAMAIFGKQGAELLPFLSEGMAGIAAKAKELEAMGGIFGDEDIAKATAAGDALDKAGKSLKIITAELAIAFAPTIEAVAKFAGQLSTAFRAAQDTMAAIGGFIGRHPWLAKAVGLGVLDAGINRQGAATGQGSYTQEEMAELKRIRIANEQLNANLSAPSW